MIKKTIAISTAILLIISSTIGFIHMHKKKYNSQITIKSDFLGTLDSDTLNRIKRKYPNIEIKSENIIRNENFQSAEILAGNQHFIELIPFTDTNKYIQWGMAADITKQMKEYGYDESIDNRYLELVENEGKIYGLPMWTYHLGIVYNRKLFKEAGLTDENGYPQYPDTYEELAQTASLIKQRTGKAGLCLPNTYGQGGWFFMNLAWSYGVEFIKEENGRVVSAFNTPECVKAVQYIKDLKWKYDALPETNFGDSNDFRKMFAEENVAMGFFVST